MRPTKTDLVAFLLGFFNFLYFRALGLVVVVELLAVFLLFLKFLFAHKRPHDLHLENKHFLKVFNAFGLIWLLSQFTSDKFHHSNSGDTIKLLAQIVVILSLVYWAQSWLVAKNSRIYFFILGYCLSTIPNYYFTPTIYMEIDPWKFCFGPAFTIIMFLWVSKSKGNLVLQNLVIFVLTFFDILMGSRSLGLITIVSWFTCLLSQKIALKRINFLFLVLGMIVASAGVSIGYHNLAVSGRLGSTQQVKALQQFGSGPLILVARSEFLFELSGIKRNFLWGAGSHPNITTEITNEVSQFSSKLGVDLEKTVAFTSMESTGKVPQHSLLFSFWLFGGVPAALFWFYILKALTKWTLATEFRMSSYPYLSRFLYISFLWNFLFSPLGAGQRVLLALSICVIYRDFQDSIKGNAIALEYQA